MRDAFGGTFMIRIMLVFIFLFVSFLAIALNFAKAFRIKDEIINYLEKNQIANGNISEVSIEELLAPYGYGFTSCLGNDENCYSGVKIDPTCEEINGLNYCYYNVYVYINRDLGFLKTLLSLTRESDNSDMSGVWTVNGKTKTIISE